MPNSWGYVERGEFHSLNLNRCLGRISQLVWIVIWVINSYLGDYSPIMGKNLQVASWKAPNIFAVLRYYPKQKFGSYWKCFVFAILSLFLWNADKMVPCSKLWFISFFCDKSDVIRFQMSFEFSRIEWWKNFHLKFKKPVKILTFIV